MRLHAGDVWGHIAPMFHLVDAFAIYAITRVGGRHVTLPAFEPKAVVSLVGAPACVLEQLLCEIKLNPFSAMY